MIFISTYINKNKNILPDYEDAPEIVNRYLNHLTLRKNRSVQTVNAYYIAVRLFIRYLMTSQGLADSESVTFSDVSIKDCPEAVILGATTDDIENFLMYAATTLNNGPHSKAQKLSSIKSFYGYLYGKAHLISNDPTSEIDAAGKKPKRLPVFMTEEQCVTLLKSVSSSDSPNASRDFCIITLFLNCGMRISELVGIDLDKIFLKEGYIRIIGKGNKERMAYLNEASYKALLRYLEDRSLYERVAKDEKALFVSPRTGTRITVRAVQAMVEKELLKAGLAGLDLSPHKFRHTAATLMYQSGSADIVELQQVLGHESISVTEIYTHCSENAVKDAVRNAPLSSFEPD